MLLVTVLSVLSGGYYAFVVVTPVYSSSAVVILEPRTDQIASYQSLTGGIIGDSPEVNSEIEILRSRSLMHLVVAKLDLLNDTEFNRSLTPPTKKVVLKSQLKDRLGWSTAPDNLSEDEFSRRATDTVVTALLKKVHVENLRQSTVFRITARSRNAAKAARIADTVVALYIENQINQKSDVSQQATAWLEVRVGQLQTELEAAETKLSQFSASSSLVSPESVQASNRKLKDVRERILSTESLRSQALQITEQSDDLVLQELTSVELAGIDQQLVTLRASEANLSTQISKQGQDLISMQQLGRETQAVRALYEHFLSRLKEVSAQQGIQKADSRVLSPAVIPYKTFAPRKSLILTMSAIFGITISAIAVLLCELSRTTFRFATPLENYTNIPVLGQLPVVPARTKHGFIQHLAQAYSGPFLTSIKALNTTLTLGKLLQVPRVIAITSNEPSSTTPLISIALAHDMAAHNMKVVLIDTVTQNLEFRSFFTHDPKIGLASFLQGNCEAKDCLFPSKQLGCDVVFFANRISPSADLLRSKAVEAFIKDMKAHYDIVIINCAAITVAPSAPIVLQTADTVLVNVTWDATTMTNIDAGQRIMSNTGLKIDGLIMTGLPPQFS